MIKRQPAAVKFVQDAMTVFFLVLIGAVVVGAALEVRPIRPLSLDIARRVAVGMAVHLMMLSVLRLIVPKPTPGSHLARMNWPYLRWLIGSAFLRVAMNPILRAPYWYLNGTRFFFLRILGAKLGWGTTLPPDVKIRDPSLLEIGAGAQIEPGVIMESAVHSAGRVHVEPITIGGGTLIGSHSILMPGASVGHDSRVAPGAFIGIHARVGVSTSVGARAVLTDRVVVHSHAVVGPGAVLSEGVVVGERARVFSGAVVPADTEIGDRELWAGPAARKSAPPS